MILNSIFGIFLAMIQIIPGSNPKQDGRNGNEHLEQGQYEEAQNAYQEGLSSYPPSEKTDQTYYGLLNNLGLSLHRQEDFEEAGRAFEEALARAHDEDAVTRSAYNAGNNAFNRQQLERALEHYQTALLANPNNEDAKFNFEFVSRQLQQEQQQSGGDDEEEQDQEENNDQQGEQDQGDEQDPQPNDDQQDEQGQEEEQDPQPSDQDQNTSEQEESDQQSEPRNTPLTQEQAERILEALENEEEQLLREIQKMDGRPRRVTKDW